MAVSLEPDAVRKWPDSGEIDFAEFYSDLASKDYPILHFPGATHDPNANVVPDGCAAANATPGSGFNIYGVLWTPTTISTYFNGVKCLTDTYGPYVTNPDTAPAPFDQPFFLNVTAALGMGLNAVNMHTPDARDDQGQLGTRLAVRLTPQPGDVRHSDR